MSSSVMRQQNLSAGNKARFKPKWDLQAWASALREFTISFRYADSACRFSLGATGGHIYQMLASHNFSPGNVGLVLPSDILIPVIGFIFLWLSYKHPKSTTTRHKLT